MQWLSCRLDAFSPQERQQAYAQQSPSRAEYLARLRRQEDRDRSLTGQLLVRKLLVSMGITTGVLHRRPNGQPYLTGCRLHVSISHCDDVVVCALSDEPVGIDVERVRPIDLRLCEHLCTPEELSYILAGKPFPKEPLCQDAAVSQRFFEVWTAKEAYFKKRGTGITDLKSVNILPLPRQIHRIDDYMVQIL